MEGLCSIGTDPLESIANSADYFYESPLGIFWIRPEAEMEGSYELGIGRLLLGTHRHPYDAAESVGRRQSGYSLWDNDQNGSPPLDLRGWQFGSPQSPSKHAKL
jgi:hypothetical protein